MQERCQHWNGIVELSPSEVWEFYHARGFDEKTKKEIKRLDGGCVFQREDFQILCQRHGLSCRHTCKGGIHIHHVEPRAYLEFLRFDEDYINRVENGVSLCAFIHLNWIHPDMGEALKVYRGDKKIIEAVFSERKNKLKNGAVYWNNRFDVVLKMYAFRRGWFLG